MGGQEEALAGPALAAEGVAVDAVAEGAAVLGHAIGEAVLVARSGGACHALGAKCSHYGGPLAEGTIQGTTVRCPWHHACFDLRSGDAVGAPALAPVACFEVSRRADRLFVLGKKDPPPARAIGEGFSVVVVGGGAAGFAAAEMLRRRGFAGSITMLSADPSAPYDRPNASKDYLAGTAPEEWMPLRGDEWYAEQRIDLRLGERASSLDVGTTTVRTQHGGIAQ